MSLESLVDNDRELKIRLQDGVISDQGSLNRDIDIFFKSLAVEAKSVETVDEHRWIKETAEFWERIYASRGYLFSMEIPEPEKQLAPQRHFHRMTDKNFKSAVDLEAYYISEERKKGVVKQLHELITERGIQSLVDNPYLILTMVGDAEEQSTNDWINANNVIMLKILDGSYDFTSTVVKDSYFRLENTWLSDVVKTDAYLDWKINNHSAISPSSHLADYYAAWERQYERLLHFKKKSSALFTPVAEHINSNYTTDSTQRDNLIRLKAERHSEFWDGSNDFHLSCATDFVNRFYTNVIDAVEKKSVDATRTILECLQKNTADYGTEMINCFEMSICVWFLNADI